MPEIYIDEKTLKPYKQCEIRRPSPEKVLLGIKWPAGYYFDIVWIEAALVRKGVQIVDADGNQWTIAEVYGLKDLPGARESFKKV